MGAQIIIEVFSVEMYSLLEADSICAQSKCAEIPLLHITDV